MQKKVLILGVCIICFGIFPLSGLADEPSTSAFSKIDEEQDVCRIDTSMISQEKTCNLTRDHLDIAKITRFYPDDGNVTLMLILFLLS